MAAGAGGGEAGVEESAATEIVAASGDEHMGGEEEREQGLSEWRRGRRAISGKHQDHGDAQNSAAADVARLRGVGGLVWHPSIIPGL